MRLQQQQRCVGSRGVSSTPTVHLRAPKTVRNGAEAIAVEECILTKLAHCTCAVFNACWAIWLLAIIGFPFP